MKHLPLSALYGVESQIEALSLLAINQKLNGAIIVGQVGIGKTQLVHSFAQVIQKPIITCPTHVTEDQLLGTIDLEKGMRDGQFVLESGLLERAKGKWLFMDDIHLVNKEIQHLFAQGMNRETISIERHGFSKDFEPKTSIIATMQPDQYELSQQLVDRFGLYIEIVGEKGLADRLSILKSYRSFAYDVEIRSELVDTWREKIVQARERFSAVQIPDPILDLIIQVVQEANCAGHRGEYFLLEAAKARAAFQEHTQIEEEDVAWVAPYVLSHRMRDSSEAQNQGEKEKEVNDNQDSISKEEPKQQDDQNEAGDEQRIKKGRTKNNQQKKRSESMTMSNQPGDANASNGIDRERTEGIDRSISLFSVQMKNIDKQKRKGDGRRALSRVEVKRGRQIKAQLPKGHTRDLSFIDTIRAAAPYQPFRTKREGIQIAIESEDFHDKVREKRTGTHLLLVVDASGSMLAKKRMRAVKGAIFTLLQDAYESRDHIGMIAFRDKQAEIVLPFTKSIDAANSALTNLSAGGKTPLSVGLAKSIIYLEQQERRQPQTLPFVVLLTDGRANVAMTTNSPLEEAFSYSRIFAERSIKSLVIDTEEKRGRQFGLAKKLASSMNANYWNLSKLQAEEVTQAVRLYL